MLPIKVNLPLKTVSDRFFSCRAVLWALDAYGDRLAEVLGESFGPLLDEGQAMPFEVQLTLFEKKLIQVSGQMVETARGYRDQKARESVSRRRRDQRAGKVNSAVVGLRQAFTGIYSEEKLAEIGFARRTPQPPGELQEQASHLVTRLSDPELDLSGSRFGDFQLDAAHLAQELVGSVKDLREAADDLAREERRSEAMKLAKDDALKEHDRWFVWIAQTVESLCRVAGLDEVAKRVRPSSRRPGVTAKKFVEPEDAESEGKAEDGEPAAEASSESSPEAAGSAATRSS